MSNSNENKLTLSERQRLAEIVQQLRWCEFECEAGQLVNNTAFQELERMATEPGNLIDQWPGMPDLEGDDIFLESPTGEKFD